MGLPPAASLIALAERRTVRALAAVLFLAAHLIAFTVHASVRYDLPWNRGPEGAPAFQDPARSPSPKGWNRLIVSRWDAQHYINIALRGYRYCPPEARRGVVPPPSMTCDLAFYPGYALLGRVASLYGLIPIDYAMFFLSLVSSWLFLFLWTGPTVVEGLGVAGTWTSLLLFNLFTTGFTLVTVQTEPIVLAAALGALVLVRERRMWLAALLAGFGAGIRISGAALSIAFTAAAVVAFLRDEPLDRRPRAWAALVGQIGLSGWGAVATVGYHAIAFHNPFLYMQAHQRSYGYSPSVWSLLWPEPAWILRSLDSALHEGIWLAAVVLFLVAGRREAIRVFPSASRAYLYGLSASVLVISGFGSVSRAFIGMNRYCLLVLPAFFAMGALLKRRPAALAVWALVSAWHYWQVDLCLYLAESMDHAYRKCHIADCRPPPK